MKENERRRHYRIMLCLLVLGIVIVPFFYEDFGSWGFPIAMFTYACIGYYHGVDVGTLRILNNVLDYARNKLKPRGSTIDWNLSGKSRSVKGVDNLGNKYEFSSRDSLTMVKAAMANFPFKLSNDPDFVAFLERYAPKASPLNRGEWLYQTVDSKGDIVFFNQVTIFNILKSHHLYSSRLGVDAPLEFIRLQLEAQVARNQQLDLWRRLMTVQKFEEWSDELDDDADDDETTSNDNELSDDASTGMPLYRSPLAIVHLKWMEEFAPAALESKFLSNNLKLYLNEVVEDATIRMDTLVGRGRREDEALEEVTGTFLAPITEAKPKDKLAPSLKAQIRAHLGL